MMKKKNTVPGHLHSRLPKLCLHIALVSAVMTALSSAVLAQEGKQKKAAEPAKSISSGPVTINLPEGMTKDQADAILNELRQIRQLLERQNGTQAAAPSAAPAVPEKVEMSVAQGWHAIGRADAPVTVVEFADFQCPFCRRFQTDSLAQLKKEFIDTGKVRFVSRDLPLDFHPNAHSAAIAARCAGDQDKYWEMHDGMMNDTATDLSQASLMTYAQKIKLDIPAFSSCLLGNKYTTVIQQDIADANKVGITATPSFVIGKTTKNQIDGVRIVGAVPYTVFQTNINALLAR